MMDIQTSISHNFDSYACTEQHLPARFGSSLQSTAPVRTLLPMRILRTVLLPGATEFILNAFLQGRLTAKEAAIVATLPLPAPLKRLQQLFEGLNTVHSFLQKKNIQVKLSVLRALTREGSPDTLISAFA